MTEQNHLAPSVTLAAPYLIYVGSETDPTLAKTGFGLRDWAPEKCAGQLRTTPDAVDLGIHDLSIEQAVAKGVRSLVVGIAMDGGQMPPTWRSDFLAALNVGMDIVSGLHTRLNSLPELAAAARANACRLIDIRHLEKAYPIATGEKRAGKRLLTVGTDCALGKKYTALAISAELQRRRRPATFRATGQTGIMIAGSGVPIDSVISDFVAGAAEFLSPDNDANHWDIIEGQGSLFHPSYAAVSLGLLHGSQPDVIVMCHDPARKSIDGRPAYPIPSLSEAIAHTLACARLTNPSVTCLGISLNTKHLAALERAKLLAKIEAETGLICFDPMVTGASRLVDRLS